VLDFPCCTIFVELEPQFFLMPLPLLLPRTVKKLRTVPRRT